VGPLQDKRTPLDISYSRGTVGSGWTLSKVKESSVWTSIVNSIEDSSANFCKGLDGTPLSSAHYGMYMVTLNELKAILKVSAQAGQVL
jgi:hypothetical protein